MNEFARYALIIGFVLLVHRLDRRAGRRAEQMADSPLCVRCGASLNSESTLHIPISGYYSHTMGRACAHCARRDRRVRIMVLVPLYLVVLVWVLDMLINSGRWVP